MKTLPIILVLLLSSCATPIRYHPSPTALEWPWDKENPTYYQSLMGCTMSGSQARASLGPAPAWERAMAFDDVFIPCMYSKGQTTKTTP